MTFFVFRCSRANHVAFEPTPPSRIANHLLPSSGVLIRQATAPACPEIMNQSGVSSNSNKSNSKGSSGSSSHAHPPPQGRSLSSGVLLKAPSSAQQQHHGGGGGVPLAVSMKGKIASRAHSFKEGILEGKKNAQPLVQITW